MSQLKDFLRRGEKNEVKLRSNYFDPSQRFLDWVNGFGFERTLIGQMFVELEKRWSLSRVISVGFYCLILCSILYSHVDFTYSVKIGSIASSDIKSPVNLEVVDQIVTEEKRREAEALVFPVFDYDPNFLEQTYDRIYRSFLTMRRQMKVSPMPIQAHLREEAIKEFMVYQVSFEKELGATLSPRTFEWLIEQRFSARVENILIRSLSRWSDQLIVDGSLNTFQQAFSEVVVREVRKDRQKNEQKMAISQLRLIDDLKREDILQVKGVEELEERDQQALFQLALLLMKPNLSFNLKETNDRRQKSREAVIPIQVKIQKNQVIVAEGQEIQPLHISILEEIQDLNSAKSRGLMAMLSAAALTLLSLSLLSFLRRFYPKKKVMQSKDLLVIGFTTLLVVFVSKVFLFLADQNIIEKLGGGIIPAQAMILLAPVFLGPMLIGLLLPVGEVVWLFAVFFAVVLSMLIDLNLHYFLFVLIGSVVAGRGVLGCSQRNGLYKAGLRIGVVNAISVCLFGALKYGGEPEFWNHLIWTIPAGFLSGWLSAVLATGLIPLIENWFDYTTDLKLLELASLNHPLMKEMIVKAPGTYHHSLIVGSMCEAAAEEIGANPLMAKVMAYYHDIGKTEHAHYFIENQRPNYNPHDYISPHMSKTVLIAHVKDGAEMAYEHKLGQPIVDGILQHHGTTLISYFYNRALQMQDEDLHQVDEDEFRYPGPKPQFREAALVMLADSIEAAARSLDDPTTSRLQSIVKNVIQNKFLDGQLDECNLTLKDLTLIEGAFRRVLLGVYHQRVDYPLRNSVTRGPSKSKRNS